MHRTGHHVLVGALLVLVVVGTAGNETFGQMGYQPPVAPMAPMYEEPPPPEQQPVQPYPPQQHAQPYPQQRPPMQQMPPRQVPQPQQQVPQQQQQIPGEYAFRPDLTNPQFGECLQLEQNWKTAWNRYAQIYQYLQWAQTADPQYQQWLQYAQQVKAQLDAAWNEFSGKCIYFPRQIQR